MRDPYTQETLEEKERFPALIPQGSVIKATFDVNGAEQSELFLLAHIAPTKYSVISTVTGNRWNDSTLKASPKNAECVFYKDLIEHLEQGPTNLLHMEVLGNIGEVDLYYELG